MRNTLRRITFGLLGAGMIAAMTVGTVVPAADAAALSPAVASVRPAALTWPIVRQGAVGERVITIQYLLNQRINARLVVDGKFGPATDAAVRAFQRRNRLVADGIVGNATWSKLVVTVRKGSKGGAVRAVQHQLRYAYGHKSVSVDGDFGAKTVNAVKVFQKNHKIVADGIVGVVTWNAMVRGDR
ncbi:MAG TPA: peptidoglycan-binding protein [Streptosporangiaceae bacterium]|nr:peptidoglycan-binding protein [Streptosporangiaceae bacterium]